MAKAKQPKRKSLLDKLAEYKPPQRPKKWLSLSEADRKEIEELIAKYDSGELKCYKNAIGTVLHNEYGVSIPTAIRWVNGER